MTEAELIRKARIKTGLTQGQLAEKLDYDSAQIISNVERGLSAIPAKVLPKACKLLDLLPETLIRMRVRAFEARLMKEMMKV